MIAEHSLNESRRCYLSIAVESISNCSFSTGMSGVVLISLSFVVVVPTQYVKVIACRSCALRCRSLDI